MERWCNRIVIWESTYLAIVGLGLGLALALALLEGTLINVRKISILY